jgi:hypothetical protein
MTNPELRVKLTKAMTDGKIHCDRLELFDSYEDLPFAVAASVRTRLYSDESYAVAWRGQAFAWISLANQLIEQAPDDLLPRIICEDLTADLSRVAA